MQSHHDDEHVEGLTNQMAGLVPLKKQFMDSLQNKAERMVSEGQSQITGGQPGEKPLQEWEAHGIYVMQLPEDEHGILRISIGGGDHLPVNANYLVFRGNRQHCIALLRAALKAITKEK